LHYEQEFELIKLLVNHGNELIALPGDDVAQEGYQPEVSVAQFLVYDVEENGLGFVNERFQQAFTICRDLVMKGEKAPDETWYARQEDKALVMLPAELIDTNHVSDNWEKKGIPVKRPAANLSKHAYQVSLRFKNSKLRKKISDLQAKMKGETDQAALVAHLTEFKKLNEIYQVVSKELNRVV
jgi:hypothetical protein